MRCRVEWDFWTSANDGCGNACDRQASFKVAMRETAQTLEKVTHYSRDCLTESHQAASQRPVSLQFPARPRLLTKEYSESLLTGRHAVIERTFMAGGWSCACSAQKKPRQF